MIKTNETDQQLITRIIKEYKHSDYLAEFAHKNFNIDKFVVDNYVFRPDNEININLIDYLLENKGIFENKTIIDMGCGSGILGIVMLMNGARDVFFVDLSPAAIENTRKNIKKFNLKNKAVIIKSDLFDKIKIKADVVIFNHPFFLDYIIEDLLLEKPKFRKATLIHNFFQKVRYFISYEGVIIMPYNHFAGIENDPGKQALKYGYFVEEVFRKEIKITQGRVGYMSIYKIKSN